MLASLKREIALMFLMPKNIYLPLAVYGIIYTIFIISNEAQNSSYFASFIASFITIFIISENTFKQDFDNGYLEKMICEQKNIMHYLFGKYLAITIFVFLPMAIISGIFSGTLNGPNSATYICALLLMYLTLSCFFNLGNSISLRRNNSLNALLIIPLLIPFIILVKEIFIDEIFEANINFLVAYFLFAASFINFIIIKVLHIQSKWKMYKYIAKYLLLPKVFRFFGVVVLPSLFIGLVGFLICSYLALFVLPADATQQEIYRILFVHVPAAIFSELIYIFMACCGFIYLVWKTKISAIMLRSAISLGLVFTLIVLISGAIWGKPTWGTYWVWDARITSTFILLIQYIGLLALRTSFNTMQTTDQILSIVAIVGAINIPIIKFSVNWWNTLHQNASITFSGSSIDAEMLYVLPLMLISFGFIAFSIFGRNIQSEIIIRQGSSKKIGELING